MGFLQMVTVGGLLLEVPDEILGSVFAAAKAGHDRGDFVSICAFDPDAGRYIQMDTSLFAPNVPAADARGEAEGMDVMLLKPVFTDGDGERTVDPVLVDQLLEVMKETRGCIVISREDELVMDADAAQRIVLNAERINPFDDGSFPDPGH